MIKRFGFWESLFSREASAINATADAVEMALEGDRFTQERIGELGQMVLTQRQELKRLQLIVKVLVDVIGESGVVNEDALEAKIEAELATLAPRQAAPAGGAPYRGSGGAAVASEPPVEQGRCARCMKYFPVNRLNITSDGHVCDVCLATS